jgi:hypothetical protein
MATWKGDGICSVAIWWHWQREMLTIFVTWQSGGTGNVECWQAFWSFVALMENGKYLEGYYSENLAQIQVDADVFAKLVCE